MYDSPNHAILVAVVLLTAGTESVIAAENYSGGVSSADSSSTLTEIVVTAQKREEKLQDVPVTINALSAADLESQGQVQLSDYAKQVPGLNLLSSAGVGVEEPVIRGISTGSDLGPLVGIYLDDIPMTPSSAFAGGETFDPDVADLDHIEVLKGPQSTLYGASALGGVIKYVTKQPDFENTSGSVRIDGSQVDGGGAGYGVRASINLPVVTDVLAVRLSVYDREDPGFIDNTYFGAKNVNWDSVKGGRLSVLFKISDDIETTFNALTQHVNTPSIQAVLLNPVTLRPLSGSLAYSSPIEPANIADASSFSDLTRWDMHFATLTNLVSFAYDSLNSLTDFSLAGLFVGAPPNDYFRLQAIGANNRLSDELRWASAPGKFEWLLAAFYTNERDHSNVYNRHVDDTGRVVGEADPFYNVFSYRYDDKYFEEAAFGDLTYHLTDQIEATVGMRYSHINQPFYSSEDGLLVNGLPNSVVYAAHSSHNSANSYLATISYKPESNTMLYVRAASAYRPGGSTPVNPILQAAGISNTYNPDRLWNYEAGIKGSFMDQRIVYTADAFHMIWTDLQLSVTVDSQSASLNAGSATSNGAEASLRIAPLTGLTVALNGAYTEAKITSDVPPINAVSGQPMPYSPKITAAALTDYRFAAAGGITPTVGATYAYHGAVNTSFTGESAVGANGVYRLPSYATLDLRAGADWSRYTLLFRVDNTANRYGLTFTGPSGALNNPLYGYVIKPRTFGLSLSARF